jgi:general secretion pathway protein N
MKLRSIVLVVLGAYAVFLVGGVPAWFATGRIAAAAPGTVDFIEPHGTLWHGAAGVRIAGAALERIEWTFLPRRLFSGEWAYSLHIADPAAKADAIAARGFSGWRVHDLAAEVQADLLSRWLPLLGAFSPGGQIRIDAARLAFDEKNIEGQAQVQWRNATLSLSEVRPLGDYGADITLRDRRADYTVKTNSGILRVAGRGTFQPPLQWSFNGEATAAPDTLPRLQDLLKMIGTPNDKGVYVIHSGGR